MSNDAKTASAERVIRADAATIFELIADPANQPRWDGNDNLKAADEGQRVHAVGDVFVMNLTGESGVRENHIVEFEEGARIAWKPAAPGEAPFGQLWRWELEPTGTEGETLVRHSYDYSGLPADTVPGRLKRAQSTDTAKLMASVDRLAAIAEAE